MRLETRLTYGLPKEAFIAIMMLYKKKPRHWFAHLMIKANFFVVIAGVLQAYTLALYTSIIRLDYVHQTSVDLIKENGFTLKES